MKSALRYGGDKECQLGRLIYVLVFCAFPNCLDVRLIDSNPCYFSGKIWSKIFNRKQTEKNQIRINTICKLISLLYKWYLQCPGKPLLSSTLIWVKIHYAGYINCRIENTETSWLHL